MLRGTSGRCYRDQVYQQPVDLASMAQHEKQREKSKFFIQLCLAPTHVNAYSKSSYPYAKFEKLLKDACDDVI